MRKILLFGSGGRFALVDNEDFARANAFKWYAARVRHTTDFYAARKLRRDGKRTTQHLHRFIMNAEPGKYIDHKDHNGLNCQKYNLRVCSRSQNQGNRRKSLNTTSRFKGVCWDKSRNRWISVMTNNGKAVNLGRFNVEKDAALAYDRAAKIYFGEFAKLNFPKRL